MQPFPQLLDADDIGLFKDRRMGASYPVSAARCSSVLQLTCPQSNETRKPPLTACFQAAQCFAAPASDSIFSASSMVKLFGCCTGGKSLKVAAHLSATAYTPYKM
jgi:hypothetical protein